MAGLDGIVVSDAAAKVVSAVCKTRFALVSSGGKKKRSQTWITSFPSSGLRIIWEFPRARSLLPFRNHPRISAATRSRVQSAAEELGYRPNPAVAAWMSHRRRVKPDAGGASIAFLNSWPDLAEWRASPWFTRFEQGARDRAKVLGCGFEKFWLAEPGMTPERMSKILRARGVRGVIIGSLPVNGITLELDWANFAAVGESLTLPHPAVYCAVSDYAHTMLLALREMSALGYRRIGYAMAPNLEDRTQHLYLSAYLGYQHSRPKRDRLPPLDWTQKSPVDLRHWIERSKPDAILSHDVLMQKAVRRLGLRAPEDLGVAVLCLHPGKSPRGLAGIDQRLERCGGVAIDLLVPQLHYNELGPPAQPVIALTRGVWVGGDTLRPVWC